MLLNMILQVEGKGEREWTQGNDGSFSRDKTLHFAHPLADPRDQPPRAHRAPAQHGSCRKNSGIDHGGKGLSCGSSCLEGDMAIARKCPCPQSREKGRNNLEIPWLLPCILQYSPSEEPCQNPWEPGKCDWQEKCMGWSQEQTGPK